MAISPIQYSGVTAPQTLDFTPLAELGKRYQEGQQLAGRRQVLSELGNNSDPASFGQGAMRLAQLGDIQGAQGLAAIQKSLAPETSADMQAYGLYRRQGGNLPFLDFKKQLAEAGATKVNNSTTVNSGEKEYDKALAKDMAEQYVGYQKAARNATNASGTLNLMENLTRDPNFYSGTGGELVTRGKQALSGIGVTAPDSAKANELFGSLANKLTVDAAGGSLGAQISNSDIAFLSRINPGLATTPEGNREIIGYQRKLYQRQQEVGRMARDYAAKNSGRLDSGFDAVVADFAEKNPLFPKQAAQPQQQSRPSSSAPEPRRAPDGNLYVPDPNRPGKYLRVIQ